MLPAEQQVHGPMLAVVTSLPPSLPCYSDDAVEPLDPPVGCKPGDRVYVEGFEHDKLGGMDHCWVACC